VIGRIPLTIRIGLGLVLIPLASLGVWAGWYFTRVWLPLNVPISLSRGHLRAEFDINVESLYAMQLELHADRTRLNDAVNLAAVAWSVSKEGRILARGTGGLTTRSIGGSDLFGTFQGGKGHYVVDLDIREDQSSLNLNEPWLLIYEDGGEYFSSTDLGAALLAALLLFGPVGIAMTILAAVNWRQEMLVVFWRSHPMTQPGPAPVRTLLVARKTIAMSRRVKSSIERPFARPSQHSLVLFLTFMMVWMFWVTITPLARHGLRVHLIRPGVTAPRSPGIQPLLVRVVRDGRSAKLYVGSDPVALEDLGALLKNELARRPPDWPVYVEGDPDLEWRQVAEAIDAVRGQQAEVILLTASKL
jgi:biopolymer transport protein ExbD